MRLIDCFIESIAYTVETAQSGTSQPYRDVKSHIISSLDSLAGHAAEGGYSEQQYRLALFATVSFIDEKLVSSSWDGKKEWSRELLQKHYFDTSNGGVEFFERLDRLNPFNPAERDIREVYYYCMALGVAGKFYGEGAQSALDKIKADNYHLLNENESDEVALFPSAFNENKNQGTVNVARNYNTLIYGGPILVLLISFFFFKKELMELANFLVISV